MRKAMLTTAGTFVLGITCALTLTVLSGAARPPAPPIDPNDARMMALKAQLDAAQVTLDDAQAVVDFWEHESMDQDSNMTRLSTYAPSDTVGPILFDRARSLSFRAAVSLQDGKLRQFTALKKVAAIKTDMIAP